MAQMDLYDGANTLRTLKPRSIVGGVAKFVESDGTPAGDRSATLSNTTTTQGRRKATLKIVIPIVQNVTEGGVTKPVVVRTSYADLTVSFDATSSEAERKDLLAYVSGIIYKDNTIGQGVLVKLEGLY